MSTFDMNAMFEYMSAMQKEIRRNNPMDAFYFAWKLEEIQPVFMWNRLQEIVSEDIGASQPTLPIVFHILKKQYFDKMNKGKDGDLELAHMIMLMASGPKSRDTVSLIDCIGLPVEHGRMEKPIPDYAFDKHTKRGKIMGRGIDHFFQVGAHLEEDHSNKEWAKLCYELNKSLGEPKGGREHSRRVISTWNKMKPKTGDKAESKMEDFFG